MELRHIPFKKMNGLGNDFVIIDARGESLRLSAALAGAIADRTRGAGCDQVIVLEPSHAADVFMRILNADGSEVSACGNASRCVAALLHPELGRQRLTIETRAGILDAEIAGSGLVTVDLGRPRFRWDEIPLSHPFDDTRAIDLTYALADGRVLERPGAINVGNPHCIFWVEDADSYDLAAFGSALEHHALFPERANISLAEIIEEKTPSIRPSPQGESGPSSAPSQLGDAVTPSPLAERIPALAPSPPPYPLADAAAPGNKLAKASLWEGVGVRGDLPSRIRLRVWERGTGITRACGTAACATAVAAARTGRTGRSVSVDLPGGVLAIEWREGDGHILMTGPAAMEFEGALHVNADGQLAGVVRHS
jgi:diaminopimelate epimerase